MECGEKVIMLSTVGNHVVYLVCLILSMNPGVLSASLLWDVFGL